MENKRTMISGDVLDEVLRKGTDAETVTLCHKVFGAAMQGSGAQPYVLDTMRLYSIPDAQGVLRDTYHNVGMMELEAFNNGLKGAKKFNIGDLSPEFIVQTGILGHQVLIGVDTSKEGITSTSYYTRNREIIYELYQKGAFGDEYDQEKIEKDIKALDNRVINGIKKVSEESDATMMHGLAYARLDIARVEKGRVELKMVIRGTYRYDIGKTLKFYPYGVMPYLVDTLRKHVKDAPIKVIQREPDGTIKTRIVSFTTKAVKVAYTGYDANLVNSKIKKTKVGWDVIGISAKAHNLESSLYTIGYSKIRLDRVQKITSVPLSDIDKTQHTVNYNNLKAHFQTCIKRWRTEEFLSFRGVDLKDQNTNGERIEVLMKWLNEVNDKNLYDMMIVQPELFGDVLSKLGERERNLPKPFKAMEMVDLPEDNIEAAKELREMLKNGIVQVTMTTTKSTNVRTEVVTTNPVLLSRMLGRNYVENYESVGVKLRYLQNLVKGGKIESGEALQKKIYQMGLGEYIDVSALDIDAYDEEKARLETGFTPGAGSTTIGGGRPRSYDQALKVVESGLENVRPSNRTPNPYHLMVKRVYAETEKDYFATVDIRNVQSVEYAALDQ